MIQRDAAARREAAAQREAAAREEVIGQLLPFLEQHAPNGDWDACAAQILAFLGMKEGEYRASLDERQWRITGDHIARVETWGSHSFFDDGGGTHGCVRRSITFIPPGMEGDADSDSPADAQTHRYTVGGAPVRECACLRNPFGLEGLFRICREQVEEYTE